MPITWTTVIIEEVQGEARAARRGCIHSVFIQHVLCAKHYARGEGYSSEHTEMVPAYEADPLIQEEMVTWHRK